MTKKPRILIANHHGALGNVMGQIAIQSGWETVVADRREALQKAIMDDNFDLVVCDSTIAQENLEIISRTDLVQTLRAAGRKVKVFLFEDEGIEVKLDPEVMKDLGGIKIFRKPVSITELRNELHAIVRRTTDEKKYE
jgi:DNA-binding response OmpR family regulator